MRMTPKKTTVLNDTEELLLNLLRGITRDDICSSNIIFCDFRRTFNILGKSSFTGTFISSSYLISFMKLEG